MPPDVSVTNTTFTRFARSSLLVFVELESLLLFLTLFAKQSSPLKKKNIKKIELKIYLPASDRKVVICEVAIEEIFR